MRWYRYQFHQRGVTMVTFLFIVTCTQHWLGPWKKPRTSLSFVNSSTGILWGSRWGFMLIMCTYFTRAFYNILILFSYTTLCWGWRGSREGCICSVVLSETGVTLNSFNSFAIHCVTWRIWWPQKMLFLWDPCWSKTTTFTKNTSEIMFDNLALRWEKVIPSICFWPPILPAFFNPLPPPRHPYILYWVGLLSPFPTPFSWYVCVPIHLNREVCLCHFISPFLSTNMTHGSSATQISLNKSSLWPWCRLFLPGPFFVSNLTYEGLWIRAETILSVCELTSFSS